MKKFIKSKSVLQIVLTSFIAALAVVGIVTAATTIGTNITTTGTLSVTGTTTFRSIDYLWPSADGSSGQFLTTNGSNALTWSTASPSSGGGWTDGGVTVYPTTMSDQFLIGTTTVAGLSQLTVEATSTAAIPLTLRGYTGQTANLFQIQDVAGTDLLTVNSAGVLTVASAITANGGLTVATGQVLNIVDDGAGLLFGGTALTANVAELNVLDGIPGTLTATELGYVDSVTSAIQTQFSNLIDGTTAFTSIDVDGGAIDGTTIGANSAAAGTFSSLIVDTDTLYVDAGANNVGVGTSTPANQLEIHAATGTTTVSVIAEAASTGGRIILEDSDGAGCSEIYVLDGVITSAIITCPAN